MRHLIITCCLCLAFLLPASAQDGTPSPDLAEIRSDVYFLASDALEGRAAGMQGELVAAEYIASRFMEMDVEPGGSEGSYFQQFTVNSTNPHSVEFTDSTGESTVTVTNVIGYVDNGADRTIAIGAHYDHLGYGHFFGSLHAGEPAIHNGADDNASGVAALLQLAEICTASEDRVNFLFIAFSGEERGLWGSNYYVKNPTMDLSEVMCMLNLDMVGRLNDEHILSINGVGTALEWLPMLETIDIDGITIVTTESGMGASDHTSFYLQDIPAIHFFTGQHSDYHKPSDDASLINYEGIASVVRYIDIVVDNLAETDALTFQKTKDDNQPSARDFKVTLGVMPDYLYQERGMRIDGVTPDRPADKGGLAKGDIVVQMGDIDIADMMSYMEALGKFTPGQTIMVIVRRGDELLEKQVTFD